MPCFKGLAVSIHTLDGPLAEYSIQKQTRQSRITSYIPVPPPKVPTGSITGKPEQATFAVSITLLVPGQRVPYSAPKPTTDDPYPLGRVVGSFPGSLGDRGKYGPLIGPYIPRTTSPNETLAAYIYFDGRPKEEVATLLRRGEETWVNSRWVSVPQAEGGGLAEREFLFAEVGLERWLNGLDLVGKEQDKQARIEKRHRKLERKTKREQNDSDDELDRRPAYDRNGVLRYGADQNSPVENVIEDNGMSDDDSDDEPPEAEAAGQIKIALFRVLASGEIKRGEYEPQFDSHDNEGENNENGNADIEHTTSFAKPKTLDPKSISTQTVTGLDPPEAPYAVYTFLYRSEKQLRKMGILEAEKPVNIPTVSKRKSTDFAKLGPLNKFGTVGFTGYRERAAPKKKDSTAEDQAMDSDADDDDVQEKRRRDVDDSETTDKNGEHLTPLDAHKQGELMEGVRKIKLKRVHSSEPFQETRKSPHMTTSDASINGTSQPAISAIKPTASASDSTGADSASHLFASPFKKSRASIDGLNGSALPPIEPAKETSADQLPNGAGAVAAPPSNTTASHSIPPPSGLSQPALVMEDEEL